MKDALIWSTIGWLFGMLQCRARTTLSTYQLARSFDVTPVRAAFSAMTWLFCGYASYGIGKPARRQDPPSFLRGKSFAEVKPAVQRTVTVPQPVSQGGKDQTQQ